ncbi:integrator complex subunit 10 [Trichuris trichiura]|uniref:Integrator complex subunit 10 n=1 Tax=Trichuris trichiura TaxID=36087 RepID=A0A077YXU6_TRITR|nr:integrator complex subunit 10 [Trichuris trichiura]
MDSQRPANRDLERWMLEKARIAKNIYDAEAMLLTAKALYPTFEIEHAAFTIHCMHQNVSGAAAAVQQMYVKFSNEPAFWAQVSRLVQAVRCVDATVDQATAFRRMVFNGLLPALQQTLLLELFEKQPDQQEKCQLVLLLIRLFPDSSASFATMLLQLLEKYEKPFMDRDPPEFFNFFTTLLVKEVVSLLLQSSSSSLKEPQGVDLLLRAVGYFLAEMLSNGKDNGDEPPAGNSQGLEDGWTSILRYFKWLANRCSWETAAVFTSFSCSKDPTFWASIEQLPSGCQEAFCIGLLLSLYAAFHLCRQLPTVVVVILPPVVCCEDESCFPSFAYSHDHLNHFLAQLDDCEAKTLFRTCTDAIRILTKSDESLVKMFDLLKAQQFAKIRQVITSCCLLLGRSEIMNIHSVSDKGACDVEAESSLHSLQLAGCLMVESNFAMAGRSLLSYVEANSDDVCLLDVSSLPAFDDWQFVLLKHENQIDYCIRSLICCLAKMIGSNSKTAALDDIIGHCIVLMQVYWPIWDTLFQWFKTIWQRRKKFTYGNFFVYVNEPEVLEEIAYVAHQQPDIEFELTPVQKLVTKKQCSPASSKGKLSNAKVLRLQIEQHMSKQRPTLEDSLKSFFSEQGERIKKCFKVNR